MQNNTYTFPLELSLNISSKIFKDKRYLSKEWLPDGDFIFHRKEQIDEMFKITEVLLKNEVFDSFFLFGGPGTGKTLSVLYVFKTLNQYKIEKNIDADFEVVYINCGKENSELKMFQTLSKELKLDYFGTFTNRYMEKIKEYILEKKKTVVIIFDEVDMLIKNANCMLLYNLLELEKDIYNIKLNNEKYNKENIGITFVCISNRADFFDRLDQRTRSRIGHKTIKFKPYNAVQLKDILEKRIEKGIAKNSIADGVISKASAIGAQEHGDARKAIELLKVSGEIADDEKKDKILLEHVEKAENIIDIDIVVEVIKSQPKQSQLLLMSIIELNEEKKDIMSGDLYLKYSDNCKKFNLKILGEKRVRDMTTALDFMGLVVVRMINMGRHGTSKIININLSETAAEKARRIFSEIFCY